MSETYLALDPGEKIILTRHRHFINILPILIGSGLAIAILMTAISWISKHPESVPAGVPTSGISAILTGLSLLALATAVVAFLVFLQTRIVLTSKYYIQVNQNGLFGRTVSKLSLDQIQDVRGTKRGVLPTLLNYGEILIETAGEEENFFFRPVGDPLNLSEVINDAHQTYGHQIPGGTTHP